MSKYSIDIHAEKIHTKLVTSTILQVTYPRHSTRDRILWIKSSEKMVGLFRGWSTCPLSHHPHIKFCLEISRNSSELKFADHTESSATSYRCSFFFFFKIILHDCGEYSHKRCQRITKPRFILQPTDFNFFLMNHMLPEKRLTKCFLLSVIL